MASLAGTKIDKYEMIEEVGHGGMAVVYRGRDQVLEREVAVKVLHPHLADREESRLRLQREAIAVAKLRHENILEIFDYSGPEAAESYIVTEFIHGVTLKDWVDDRLDPRPAVAAMIVHRLCLALQHAHRGGIVHRDIKPENVMIRNDGVLKLMDFGIAQIIDNQKLTLTGQLIGSPAYMAPELISGRPLDQRTDLFSLGILLYQLATGCLPFTGRNPHEVLNRIADGDYPPAASICPLVDRELEDIIALALASDPDERYQSVETFGQELSRYLEEVGLEPSNTELARYFRDPKKYVVELDERVCETLTDRARTAAHDGETSRAIRLLGRVLEIDANHEGATALLQKLRQRERRNRRLALTGAALLTGVVLVLLVRFLPSPDPPGDRIASAPAASAHDADPIDDADPDPDPGSTGVPAVMPPERDSTGPGPDMVADVDTEGELVVGGSTGTDEPSSSDDGRVRPRKNPVDAPPRVPVTTPCRLSFTGIPLPTAKNLKVLVGATAQPITGLDMDVELEGTAAVVQVRDARFGASRRISRAECEAGPVVVDIKPRPAKLKFVGIDGNVVVVCTKGCPKNQTNRHQLARDFEPIPIHPDNLQPRVSLTFKHENFRELELPYDLQPGPNTIKVAMVPM